jgi:tetratricopeptide (TPR) repeat protein
VDDNHGALSSFRKATQQEGCLAWAYHDLGAIQMDIGNTDAAIAAFRSAIDFPGWTGSFQPLAQLLTSIGNAPAAIKTCRQHLALDPSDVQALIQLVKPCVIMLPTLHIIPACTSRFCRGLC